MSGCLQRSATVPPGTSGVSLMPWFGCQSWDPWICSFKGPQGGFPYRLQLYICTFSHAIFEHPLGDNFEAFGCHSGAFWLPFCLHFGCPGPQKWSPKCIPIFNKPKPWICGELKLSIILMIPKASQKAPKWRQNPFQIDDFCKMHSWSYFFHLLFRF